MGRQYRNSHNQRRQPINPTGPIELPLKQPYYDMIDRGQKTIEGRVAYRWLDRAAEGGQIDFKRGRNDPRIIRCGIDWVLRAANFEEALIEVEWQKCIPNVKTFDDALAVYDRIYTPDKIKEIGGVVLIGFTKQE